MKTHGIRIERARDAARVVGSMVLAAVVIIALVQPAWTPPAGAIGDAAGTLPDHTPRVHAFEGARIMMAPGRVLEKGAMVVRDGIIEAVGPDIAIPADAVRHDMSGLTIHAGFIDLGASFGLPDTVEWTATGSRYFTIRPELDAAALFQGDSTKEESYRKAGFTSALVTPSHGILRGRAALVSLAREPVAKRLLLSDVAMGAGFDAAGNDSFPESLMGRIALARQTLMDAAWYRDAWRAYRARTAGQEAPEANVALEAMQPVIDGTMPLLWQVSDELDALRADRIAREAKTSLIILGSGFEYRRLDALKALDVPVVVPVTFPPAPDVSTAEEARAASLRELRHFVLAPSNAAELDRAGVRIALTARGLDKVEEFPARVRSAIEAGLGRDRALAALTTIPADIAGQGTLRGTIEKGRIADFVVIDGEYGKTD